MAGAQYAQTVTSVVAVVGEALRTARYVKVELDPDTTPVDALILAVTVTLAPGATVTGDGTDDVRPTTVGLAETDQAKVELPQAAASAFRTVRDTVPVVPRIRSMLVERALSVGVPRAHAGDGDGDEVGDGDPVGVGVGVGDLVGVGVGVAVEVGVGVGRTPAAAATALAASTIPAPQPAGQPFAASGCAVCWMSAVTWAGVNEGLAANKSAATAETCGVAMLVPEYRAYDGATGPCVPVLRVDQRLTPGAAISMADP